MSATVESGGWSPGRSLRKYRNYRLYFCGQLVSACGNFLQDLALPWLVLQLTGSPFLVGLVVFCRYAPFSLAGLWGGVAADRYDNRRVLLVTQSVAAVVATSLAAMTFTHATRTWAVFLLALAFGVVLVFDNPSRNALTYQLVGPDELSNAIALNSSLQSAARILGPAVGGVLIAAFGVGWCFTLNAFSFVAVIAALLLMRTNEFFAVERSARSSSFHAVVEVLRYFRGSPEFLAVMTVSLSIGLCGFSVVRTQLPLLTTMTLHDSSRVFGFLYASYGAGALIGALLSAAAARAEWRKVYLGAVGLSAALLAVAPVRSAVVDGVLLVVVGVCWILFMANAQALLQLAAPDRLRGRVIALFVYGLMAPAPLGSIAAGWLTDVGGTTLSFGVAGVLGLVAIGASAVLIPESRVHLVRSRREATPLVHKESTAD